MIHEGVNAEYPDMTLLPDTTLLLEPDAIATSYGSTRRRITTLLRTAGPDEVANVTVPACPEWTVTQLAAHVCGVCDDILAGNIAAAGTDPWTAEQVESYADTPLATILDRWDEVGATIEDLMPAFPTLPASQVVFDTTTHEHDFRGALTEPGARDSDGIVAGLGFLLTALDRVVRAQDLPTLGVRAGDHAWKVGDSVMWDNTGTLHRAMPYDPDCGRLLKRTILLGEEAFS